MRCVISQPMYFPWLGLFEQMRLADVWVHYDDVQLSRSGFVRRVQVKGECGRQWLTVPLAGFHRGQLIGEVRVEQPCQQWIDRQRGLLARAYASAPHYSDMDAVFHAAFASPPATLADAACASMEAIRSYFGLAQATTFVRASSLGIGGAGSERILAIVREVGADTYVTGHGGRNYLRHEEFEASGIRVEYMDYRLARYPQLHGEFTPYVSALDLIANEGRAGENIMRSPAVDWRTFLSREKTERAS